MKPIRPGILAKAHALIAKDAEAAHRANGCCCPGATRKRHRPYSLTPKADLLVEALGRNDEETVAALLLDWDRISPAG